MIHTPARKIKSPHHPGHDLPVNGHREGCQFTFPELTDNELITFGEAPTHVRFAFQGRALVQFMGACMRLLREQLDEAEKNNPEELARLRKVEKDLGQEWKDAGLP